MTGSSLTTTLQSLRCRGPSATALSPLPQPAPGSGLRPPGSSIETTAWRGRREKDIENAKVASIAGAEVDSRTATLDRQLCLVGAPRSKRLALADLTLDLCALPGTSDALHACIMGSWSSVFTFRRPCFCVFLFFVCACAVE